MFKRTVGLAAAIIGAVTVTMTTGVFAAQITQEDAQKTALTAVGLTEDQVIFQPVEKDADDGMQLFEVDFFVPGEVKYEFDINADTGAIVEQSIEMWEADDDFEYASLIEAAKAGAEGTASIAAGAEAVADPDGGITELQAKMIALKDSGLNADAVTYTKCKKDLDDGIEKFEIELRAADGTEYEYDINAADGTILEKDIDRD